MAPKTTVFNYELLYLHEIQLISVFWICTTSLLLIIDYGGIDYSDYSIQNYIKGNLLFLVRLIFK